MKPIAALFLLAIPFGITAALAAVFGLLIWPWYGRSEYVKNVYRTMDRLGAAFLGIGDGRYTVSAECGSRPNCKVCALLCRFLDIIQPGHCSGAAKKERG